MQYEITSAVADGGCAIGSIERPFNPWREPATETAGQLINLITHKIVAHEHRKRRRRPNDQAVFLRATRAITCDLLADTLHEDGKGIYLSRSHRDLARKTRYDHPANTRQLPGILDSMISPNVGLITQALGCEDEAGNRRSTVVRGTEHLRELAAEANVKPQDFVVVPGGESIVLKRAKHDFWDNGGYLEYVDTGETRLLRSSMDRINGWLHRADLTLVDDQRSIVDLSDRQLRRIFTQGNFRSGGRLFGGFWQPINKQQRLSNILIDGEPIVEVDYGQIMPRLVYAHCDITASMTDLYAIEGFEEARPGIKKVMCSMLFQQKRLMKMPKGTRTFFPKRVSIAEVVHAIEAAHPAIRSAFHTGIGHRCQYLESKIIASVLLRLNHRGITALPIHDAVLVPASAADITQQVMLEVFHDVTGAEGVVEVVGK